MMARVPHDKESSMKRPAILAVVMFVVQACGSSTSSGLATPPDAEASTG
jgi:hypothetical protein